MKRFTLFLLVFSCLFLSAEEITFSGAKYTTTELLEGVVIDSPEQVLIGSEVKSYPEKQPVDPNQHFQPHKYSLVVLHSPYTCQDCYGSNCDLVIEFAKNYENQVYLLIENWNIRDTELALKKLGKDSSIQILLDSEGKNIRRLSALHEDFINAGFIVIDDKNRICYLQMASFTAPYNSKKMAKIFNEVEAFLKQN
ncbi:MAG: hypothetical protein R6U84_01940 [Candidatus Cloacimonadales bacterium]